MREVREVASSSCPENAVGVAGERGGRSWADAIDGSSEVTDEYTSTVGANRRRMQIGGLREYPFSISISDFWRTARILCDRQGVRQCIQLAEILSLSLSLPSSFFLGVARVKTVDGRSNW